MEINKITPSVSSATTTTAQETKIAKATDAAVRLNVAARKVQAEAVQTKMAAAAVASNSDEVAVVKVSSTAQAIQQAVRQTSGEEAFDQKKVDRIRRAIAEGKFAIDEEALARKFIELEKQLGDLGRS